MSYAEVHTHSLNSTSVAVLKTFSTSEHIRSPNKNVFLYLFVCLLYHHYKPECGLINTLCEPEGQVSKQEGDERYFLNKLLLEASQSLI